MGQINNYHRFYASLNRLPGGNTEDMKETLVSSFTDGRTTSLKEMTQKEYNAMCASLEERTGWKERLKRKRLEEESRRAIQVMEWKGSLWISVGGEPLLGAVDTREGLLKTVSKMRETWISRKIKK